MKITLVLLLVLLIPVVGMSFSFTQLMSNPAGKIIVGGYYLFLAYQVLSPKPIVITMPVIDIMDITAFNYGGFIVIDDSLTGNVKTQALYHEREHLYQTAVLGLTGMSIEYFTAGLVAFITGQHWYKDNYFEILAYDVGIKNMFKEPYLYFEVSLEF
jgi:hypothetical protein